MSYIFNRTSLLIIAIVGIVFVLATNEVVKLVDQIKRTNIATYERLIEGQLLGFEDQTECQLKTNSICEYERCDFIPLGKTIEDVCGENFVEGWKKTGIPIPNLYKNVETLQLTIQTPSSVGEIEILPYLETITYQSNTARGAELFSGTKAILLSDITRLLNKMILYELLRASSVAATQNDTVYTLYLASKELPPAGSVNAHASLRELSIQCIKENCRRDFLDIVQEISRLWGDDIRELQ